MSKQRIALIFGGISSEREVSLSSGKQVLEALDQKKYDIHHYDPKTDLAKLAADAAQIDAALIILHGPYGEDGTIQGMLDMLGIPYQGSGVLASALAMDKVTTKKLYSAAGIPTPAYLVFDATHGHTVDKIVDRLGLPVVIKPALGGSSIGMSIVREKEALAPAIANAFTQDRTVMVEAFIKGIELTGGVLGNDNPRALPLIEIRPSEKYTFFDYEAKYKPGASEEICPAPLDETVTQKAQSFALAAHQTLGCMGYSRTDMMLADGDLHVLETNTIPGMTATSLFPQAAAAAGLPFRALLDRLIGLAIDAQQNKPRRFV